MLSALRETLAIDDAMNDYFREPNHLAMLMYACESKPDRIRQVGKELDLTLPVPPEKVREAVYQPPFRSLDCPESAFLGRVDAMPAQAYRSGMGRTLGDLMASRYVVEHLHHLGIVAEVCRQIGVADRLAQQGPGNRNQTTVSTPTWLLCAP